MLLIAEWIRRYLPAELAGTLAALLVASALAPADHALVALGAAGAETLAFYGVMAARDMYTRRHRQAGASGPSVLLSTARALVWEFGSAEVLDSVLLGPALAYACLHVVPQPLLAVLLSKLLTDLAFYGQAILAIELRKAYHLGNGRVWGRPWTFGRRSTHEPRRAPAAYTNMGTQERPPRETNDVVHELVPSANRGDCTAVTPRTGADRRCTP